MTARIWRYCGSAAVMISELVAGSAWIWPPVEGWADGCVGVVAGLASRGSGLRGGLRLRRPAVAVAAAGGACAAWSAAMAARKVMASLAASAFFR